MRSWRTDRHRWRDELEYELLDPGVIDDYRCLDISGMGIRFSLRAGVSRLAVSAPRLPVPPVPQTHSSNPRREGARAAMREGPGCAELQRFPSQRVRRSDPRSPA